MQVSLDDYKVVLFRNQPDGWVAEIPAIPGCYALMPTREEALAELAGVFRRRRGLEAAWILTRCQRILIISSYTRHRGWA